MPVRTQDLQRICENKGCPLRILIDSLGEANVMRSYLRDALPFFLELPIE